MAYNRVQVRSLLSDSETPLFESSLGASCKALGPIDLRHSLKRARTLRDKARDLLRKQRLATRARTGSKGGIGGVANERTAEKVTVFEEIIARFEAEAARREAPAKESSARRRTPAAAPAMRKAAAGTGKAKTTPAKKVGSAAKVAAVKKASTALKKTAAKKAVNEKAAKTTTAGGAAPSPARPAAKVLREALVKKKAARGGQAPGAKAAGGAKAPARGNEAAPVGGVRATEPSTRARAVSSRLADSNLSHIQGHTSTQVRRGQAKRDQKG
jgi:hypothetical protein